MRLVVVLSWQGLTSGAEISIVADCALVPIASDIVLASLVLAQWPVTLDAMMTD